jgi:hypothetical protein
MFLLEQINMENKANVDNPFNGKPLNNCGLRYLLNGVGYVAKFTCSRKGWNIWNFVHKWKHSDKHDPLGTILPVP